MPEPIRILHLFVKMARGGAQLRMMDVMRNIDHSKFQLNFCSHSGKEGVLDSEVRDIGGNVYYCTLRSLKFPWEFIRLLREQRFDIVHSPMHLTSGYILWLAALAGIPRRIAHFWSTDDGRPDTLRRRVQRRIMAGLIDRYATDILAVSRSTMTRVWGEGWQEDPRCQVVYGGIRAAQFQIEADGGGVREEFGFAPTCPLCIHVGRFVRAKNHVRLIDIFAELSRRMPEARLITVGRHQDESIAATVRQKIRHEGLTEKIAMAGERTDIPRLLAASDLMVFPSIREGLPGAVLEAGAAGLPVLASAIPGTEEIADAVPLVQCLPLEKNDDQWASLAGKMIEVDEDTRRRAQDSFMDTDFTASAAARKLSGIWRQAQDE